jgi:hypothetical protein
MPKESNSGAKSKHLDFETVGSIVAIVIGLAALYVSWTEVSNSRQDRLASALPVMETGVGLVQPDEVLFRARVENAGVGTALVYSAALLLDGSPIETGERFQSELLTDALPFSEATVNLDGIELRPVPAGEAFAPLMLSWAAEDIEGEVPESFFAAVVEQRLELRLCFCDVYERCWTTRNDSFPKPVARCPEPTGFPVAVLR